MRAEDDRRPGGARGGLRSVAIDRCSDEDRTDRGRDGLLLTKIDGVSVPYAA